MLDPFDPNTWVDAEHECRIYADDNDAQWAVVDQVDYQYLIQWKWSIKFSRHKRKFYLRRNLHCRVSDTWSCLFLHTAIMKRAGIEPPTPLHVLVDHDDGDGLNCRRHNMQWATHSQNRRNTANYRNAAKRRLPAADDLFGVRL
jgi:hypothetical protein